MNKIKLAYFFSILNIIIALFPISIVFNMNYAVVTLIQKFASIIIFGIVVNLIWRDAKSRDMPIYHGFWAFLGLIGVLIYHIGFVKKEFCRSKEEDNVDNTIKGTMSLVIGIVSSVFLFLFFPIAFVLGLIAIILAHYQKKEGLTRNANLGKFLGFISIVFSLVLLLIISGYLIYFFNLNNATKGLSLEDNIIYCNDKSDIGYTLCLPLVFHKYGSWDELKNGNICNFEDNDNRISTCIYIGLKYYAKMGKFYNFCEGIEKENYRNECIFIKDNDEDGCERLPSDQVLQCQNRAKIIHS